MKAQSQNLGPLITGWQTELDADFVPLTTLAARQRARHRLIFIPER